MTLVRTTKQEEIITRTVVLEGLRPIMFDRYAGDNDTKLTPEQKLYFVPGDSKGIALPSINVISFLSAHNTNSAPKRLRDKRKFKDICNACLSFVSIDPDMIPFTRNGNPIAFGKFTNDHDTQSSIWIHRSVARLDKGIPNPKVRPVLPLPWSLEFSLTILPNNEIQEQELMNLFDEGGRAIGLGTFRGPYGKFRVASWT
jgi:hypothetical protein